MEALYRLKRERRLLLLHLRETQADLLVLYGEEPMFFDGLARLLGRKSPRHDISRSGLTTLGSVRMTAVCRLPASGWEGLPNAGREYSVKWKRVFISPLGEVMNLAFRLTPTPHVNCNALVRCPRKGPGVLVVFPLFCETLSHNVMTFIVFCESFHQALIWLLSGSEKLVIKIGHVISRDIG